MHVLGHFPSFVDEKFKNCKNKVSKADFTSIIG
jgi:hypothetical protein